MITVPARMADRPRDKRGFPVPWNVLVDPKDGTPFFTVNDDRRHLQALRQSLCPLCGGKLGRWKWFVGGPLSAFAPQGWFLDLPGHRECMEFALQTCPYLSMPRWAVGDHVANPDKLAAISPVVIDETVIPDRPEVFVAVASDEAEIKTSGPYLPYVRPMKPLLGYTLWRHGRQISLDEAFPYLRAALGRDWMPSEVRKET